MNTIARLLPLLFAAVAAVCCSSCASNEQFEGRMERRNDAYSGYGERRETRLDARQERTDAWYDRVMH